MARNISHGYRGGGGGGGGGVKPIRINKEQRRRVVCESERIKKMEDITFGSSSMTTELYAEFYCLLPNLYLYETWIH